MNKSLFLSTLVLLLAATSFAQESSIFIKDSAAIGGYDPVAFFTESKPVKGKADITTNWHDATWRFASDKNRQLFIANPDQYAPQYGGYCAYGTAEGHKAPTQADTWTIVDNKLYFNYNQAVKKGWMKDQQALINKADKNWETIKDKE